MDRIEVVQETLKRIKAAYYLEIGVAAGDCFLKIKAPHKIAVDPHPEISRKKKRKTISDNPWNLFNRYYRMTSDNFFEVRADLKSSAFWIA